MQNRFVEDGKSNGQLAACLASLLLSVVLMPVLLMATHIKPSAESETDGRGDVSLNTPAHAASPLLVARAFHSPMVCLP